MMPHIGCDKRPERAFADSLILVSARHSTFQGFLLFPPYKIGRIRKF